MILSLINGLENLDIVLASTSPRRFELLKSLGLTFRVAKAEIDEVNSGSYSAVECAVENARRKGQVVASMNENSLVISADTVVTCNNEILGKPVDEQDAAEMLLKLSGKTHEVITAFGLWFARYDVMKITTVTTRVSFRPLDEAEILAYIATGEPFDKAGAYGIQGQGALLVERIDGCYYNVVGFPLTRFYQELDQFMSHFVL